MRNEALHRICAGFLLAGCLGAVVTAPAGAAFVSDAPGDVVGATNQVRLTHTR